MSRVRTHLSEKVSAAYIIGGAVRSALLQNPIADLDMVISGDTKRIASGLARALGGTIVELNSDHQTYRIVLKKENLNLDLSPIRQDLQTDLKSRDFTVNALAIPLSPSNEDPNIIDPTKGLEDLANAVIRSTHDDVFKHDGVRLLRAIRLTAELGFQIETNTSNLIRRDAQLLNLTARERVRDEFFKAIAPRGANHTLRLMDEHHILREIIPELESCRGVGRSGEHYWDVLQHSFECVGHLETILRCKDQHHDILKEVPWDKDLQAYFDEPIGSLNNRGGILKIGALLHDIGKPSTRVVETGGRMRFIGHPRLGSAMAKQITQRLRFSNRETQMIMNQVEHHLRPGLITREPLGPTKRATYRYFRDVGDVAIDTIFLSLADYLAARGPLLQFEKWREYCQGIHNLLTSRKDQHPSTIEAPKLVDGHTLLRELQLQPGPLVGDLLKQIHEAHVIGQIVTPEEALGFARQILRGTATSKIKPSATRESPVCA